MGDPLTQQNKYHSLFDNPIETVDQIKFHNVPLALDRPYRTNSRRKKAPRACFVSAYCKVIVLATRRTVSASMQGATKVQV